MAKSSKSATALEAEVTQLLNEAVFKLLTCGSNTLRLQTNKQETGLFPAGKSAKVLEAIARGTKGDSALFSSVGMHGKVEQFELSSLGKEAIGLAVEQATATMPTSEAIRLAESILEKNPETILQLESLFSKFEARRLQEAELEAEQRQKTAEQEQRIREAFKRWEANKEAEKKSRIEFLRKELAELGVSPEPLSAVPTQTVLHDPASQKEKDFRNAVAALLVQNSRAIPAEQKESRRYFDAVLFNLPGVRRIGKAGEVVAFHPADHDCESEVAEKKPVKILEPGWLLQDDLGIQILAKAVVIPAT